MDQKPDGNRYSFMSSFGLIVQRTDEWFDARKGKVTSSRGFDILPGKSGYKASRKNYMAELVCEILTGQVAESFQSQAMAHGVETEEFAVSAYEAKTGIITMECGFIDHPTIPMFGASPDRLVGTDGLLEVKCPNTATHLDTLINGTVDYKYVVQMNVQMMCTERFWCDFVSYDDRLPEKHSLFIKRYPRNEKLIAEIAIEVGLFRQELNDMLDKLSRV